MFSLVENQNAEQSSIIFGNILGSFKLALGGLIRRVLSEESVEVLV